MFNASMKFNFNNKFNVVKLLDGNILSINSMKIIKIEHFNPKSDYLDYFDNQLSILLEYYSNIGMDDENIYQSDTKFLPNELNQIIIIYIG